MTSSTPYSYDGLESIYVDIAKKELKEDPKKIHAHIASLRSWLHQSKHIKNCPDDDAFLLQFLRVAKFNHENAQARVENFCSIRGSEERGAPYAFRYPSLDDPRLLKYMRLGLQVPCGYNEKGEMVLIASMKNWDPDDMPYSELLVYLWMGVDVMTSDQRCQIAGVTALIDVEGMTRKQFNAMMADQTIIKNNIRIWQDAYTFRNREVYYYKEPLLFDILFNIIKIWIKPKLLKRLHRVRNDLNKIHEKMPGAKKILPKEYGGENGTMKELLDKWEKTFMEHWSNKPYQLRDLTVDESLRPKDTLKFLKEYKDHPDDVFGTKGTFTKIEAD